jgi:hypothetical protein
LSSAPVFASNTETDESRLFVAISLVPSCVTPMLYTPLAAGRRRRRVHALASTSTISFDLWHATQMTERSGAGTAHVGEHVASAWWCPPPPCCPGGPGMPWAFGPSMKWRATASLRASISISMSSIMHAE